MNLKKVFAQILLTVVMTLLGFGCVTTLPSIKHSKFKFPENVFVEDTKRPLEKLGLVRAKVNYASLDVNSDENALCKNYYNKAAVDLLKMAKDKGGDAVVSVQSVVFLQDGRTETYKTPECSDDGEEGQILLQGIAVKWKIEEKPSMR